MGTYIYIVATRPYPEKVANGRFHMNFEDAEDQLDSLPEGIRKSFMIFEAEIKVHKNKIEPLDYYTS